MLNVELSGRRRMLPSGNDGDSSQQVSPAQDIKYSPEEKDKVG